MTNLKKPTLNTGNIAELIRGTTLIKPKLESRFYDGYNMVIIKSESYYLFDYEIKKIIEYTEKNKYRLFIRSDCIMEIHENLNCVCGCEME